MTLCKKHGKERDRIVKSKPSSRGRGAILEYVGCEDCAAGLPPSQEATPKPAAKAKKPKDESKQQTPHEAIKQAKKAIEQAKKVRSIGERFGFKF